MLVMILGESCCLSVCLLIREMMKDKMYFSSLSSRKHGYKRKNQIRPSDTNTIQLACKADLIQFVS